MRDGLLGQRRGINIADAEDEIQNSIPKVHPTKLIVRKRKRDKVALVSKNNTSAGQTLDIGLLDRDGLYYHNRDTQGCRS